MIMRISPGGEIRAIYDDTYPFTEIHGGEPPVRASHVEPIQTGPNAGKWFVDMSPLGEEYQYCLWPPFEKRAEALAAEHDHIVKHWLT